MCVMKRDRMKRPLMWKTKTLTLLMSEFYVLYLIRMDLYTTVPVVNTKLQNTIHSVRKEEKKK